MGQTGGLDITHRKAGRKQHLEKVEGRERERETQQASTEERVWHYMFTCTPEGPRRPEAAVPREGQARPRSGWPGRRGPRSLSTRPADQVQQNPTRALLFKIRSFPSLFCYFSESQRLSDFPGEPSGIYSKSMLALILFMFQGYLLMSNAQEEDLPPCPVTILPHIGTFLASKPNPIIILVSSEFSVHIIILM